MIFGGLSSSIARRDISYLLAEKRVDRSRCRDEYKRRTFLDHLLADLFSSTKERQSARGDPLENTVREWCVKRVLIVIYRLSFRFGVIVMLII